MKTLQPPRPSLFRRIRLAWIDLQFAILSARIERSLLRIERLKEEERKLKEEL